MTTNEDDPLIAASMRADAEDAMRALDEASSRIKRLLGKGKPGLALVVEHKSPMEPLAVSSESGSDHVSAEEAPSSITDTKYDHEFLIRTLQCWENWTPFLYGFADWAFSKDDEQTAAMKLLRLRSMWKGTGMIPNPVYLQHQGDKKSACCRCRYRERQAEEDPCCRCYAAMGKYDGPSQFMHPYSEDPPRCLGTFCSPYEAASSAIRCSLSDGHVGPHESDEKHPGVRWKDDTKGAGQMDWRVDVEARQSEFLRLPVSGSTWINKTITSNGGMVLMCGDSSKCRILGSHRYERGLPTEVVFDHASHGGGECEHTMSLDQFLEVFEPENKP